MKIVRGHVDYGTHAFESTFKPYSFNQRPAMKAASDECRFTALEVHTMHNDTRHLIQRRIVELRNQEFMIFQFDSALALIFPD
jgi:hypothetical protein